MKTSWTDGIEDQRASEVKQNFKESAIMRRRLVELLHKEIAISVRESRGKDNYSRPNWAYEQADARGYERAIAKVIELVTE